MRIIRAAIGMAIAAISVSSATAQMVESKLTASNGVVITKNSDDFSQRYEYTSPRIETRSSQNALTSAIVAKVRDGKSLGDAVIQGFIIYFGEWKYFDSAVFKGGDAVNYTKTSGKVETCRNGCEFSERFVIHLSQADIAKHAESGAVPVQIRSQTGDTVLLSVPVSYVVAINEIAK